MINLENRAEQIQSPLTFKDDEWQPYFGDEFLQNVKNPDVFKDNRPYYIRAYYMKDQDNIIMDTVLRLDDRRYVAKNCYIKDPNNMPSICIDVIRTELEDGTCSIRMKDPGQLDELRKYYDIVIREF